MPGERCRVSMSMQWVLRRLLFSAATRVGGAGMDDILFMEVISSVLAVELPGWVFDA